jgi:hypothetical protein
VAGSPKCTLSRRSSPTTRQPPRPQPLAEIDVLASLQRLVETADRKKASLLTAIFPAAQPSDIRSTDGGPSAALQALHPRPIRRRSAEGTDGGDALLCERVHGGLNPGV